jgi:NAD+ kinase
MPDEMERPPDSRAGQRPGSQSTTASPRAIRRVGIVAKSHLTAAAPLLGQLASWLAVRQVDAVFEEDTSLLAGDGPVAHVASRDDLPRQVDLIVVLGGDGTLLAVANRIARVGASIPILGVNFGSLGFLTEITLPEMYPALEAALAGSVAIEERLMLRCHASRPGEKPLDYLVLNDVVITKGALSRMIDLSVWIEDQFVATFKADGLILATPTGSTAYNLSAAGPIVHPAVDAFVLTPIAPHTLTNRPIVIPAGQRVRIKPRMRGEQEEIYATFDGQTGIPLERRHELHVWRAETPLRLVRAVTRTYFEVLRQKLKWAER